MILVVVVIVERMMAMRERIQRRGEMRLELPDARATKGRRRVPLQVAGLRRGSEDEALRWIEAVAELNEANGRGNP